MTHSRQWLQLSLALAALSGCSTAADQGSIAAAAFALNACEEDVPDNRSVDGFPAYAQCADVEDASIYSNNGIDTSLTSGGSDWILTQRGGGYQCTEWAFRYMYFRWNVQYRHGNAREWCDGMLPSGLVKSTVPVHGDLIVFDAGSCGADATTGHVAVIDAVDNAAASVTIVEQNRAGRRSTKQSCALCFLHAVANDGSVGGSGGAGAGGIGGMPLAGGGTGGASGGAQGGRGGRAPTGGVTATGGVTVTGGAISTGGAIATGGAISTGIAGSGGTIGGAPPTGGVATGGALSSGSPSAGAPDRDAHDAASDGCSVSAARPSASGGVGWLALVGGLLGARLRRTRRIRLATQCCSGCRSGREA
jgi:MYXO-CTERM domain-containing protein